MPAKIPLYAQVIIAIIIATIIGLLTGTESTIIGIKYYSIYDFLGALFLNALKMVVVPLVTASIICGVSNFGQGEGLGRLGLKTIGFYLGSCLLAVILGLTVINLFTPGYIDGKPAGEKLHLNVEPEKISGLVDKVANKDSSDIVGVFLRMVPPNIIYAAAEGQMLGLIFFSIIFGIFMMRIAPPLSENIRNFWQAIFETMMLITMWIMRFAPIGIFGLVAKTVASTGFAAFEPVMYFFFAVLLSLGLHTFVTMSLIIKFFNINPIKHFVTSGPALLTAFSTASSSATLPLTMEIVQEKSGVSNRISSFVLPLGATINMNGTALYECMAAMFIAQAYGLDITLTTQFIIVITALLTSIGVAGIPSASLVAISIILTAVGLPLEGLGLLLITDRVLDMLRTAVNVYGDTCAAVTIAKTENEKIYG